MRYLDRMRTVRKGKGDLVGLDRIVTKGVVREGMEREMLKENWKRMSCRSNSGT